MSKTYAQYIAEVRSDLADEGYEADIILYFDIADSLLDDAKFKALAQAKFPGRNDVALKECVAHSI